MAKTVAGATVGAHCDARAASAAGANITSEYRKMRRRIACQLLASARCGVTPRNSQLLSVEIALAAHGEEHSCVHSSGRAHADKIPEKGYVRLVCFMLGGI